MGDPSLNPAMAAKNAERADAARRKDLAERNRLEDFRWLMADRRGRNILRHLQVHSLAEGDAIHPTSTQVYVNLGRQKVWKLLEKDLKAADFNAYLFFLRENGEVLNSPQGSKGDK